MLEEPQAEATSSLESDAAEYLSVMLYHLNEIYWALSGALGYVQASDLAASYHQGLLTPKESQLAKKLERSHTTLANYLGLSTLDNDKEIDDESISEKE